MKAVPAFVTCAMLVALLAVADAGAAPKTPPKPASSTAPAAKPAAPPVVPRGSAMAQIAAETAEALGAVPAGTLVVVSPLTSDVPTPKGDELALRVAAQIAGRLGSAQVHPQTASLAVARGASGRAASLVYVQLELAKGQLRATVDLYPSVANSWDRLRNPAPGPKAHAFAGSPIDAEVRTFLPPILLEQASVHKVTHDETDVLAVGCGDIDADGGNELVIATRTRVSVGKLQKDKLGIVKMALWSQLASRSPVPMREPMASIVIDGRHNEVLLGSTDRGGVAVDASLVTRRPLTGLPIAGGSGELCAFPSPELGAFDGSSVSCKPPRSGDPVPVMSLPTTPFDAAALLDLVAKDGAPSQIAVAREPSGKLRLRRIDANGKAIETPVDGAGAQIAAADLDLDGTPEIAFSSEAGEGDALSIYSWQNGAMVQRLRVPTKDPIFAIAACPPEEKGLPGLVAVVGSEIWLVR